MASRQAKHARLKRNGWMVVPVLVHRQEAIDTLQEAGELKEWDEPYTAQAIGEAIARWWQKMTEIAG